MRLRGPSGRALLLVQADQPRERAETTGVDADRARERELGVAAETLERLERGDREHAAPVGQMRHDRASDRGDDCVGDRRATDDVEERATANGYRDPGS